MRPRVTVNAAMSLDGRLALTTGEQTRLSSDEDMERVHALRREVDAILVGVNTVISDDPRLAPHPDVLRVVLDTWGRTPPDSLVMSTPPRTLLAMGPDVAIDAPEGVIARHYPLDRRGVVDLEPLLGDIADMGVRHLLVEGGGHVIWSFLRRGLFDTLIVFVADVVIGGDATSLAMGEGAGTLGEMIRLEFRSCERMDGGILLTYGLGKV